jgi:hypothetical protein
MALLDDIVARISFDEVALALVFCVVLREWLVATLPDRIAGPGGWLIDTGPRQNG